MTVLLLAGTGEAKRIAWGLADTGRKVIASLAGVTRSPDPLPIPTRIGGFGGVSGLVDFLHAEQITHVIDATHPFAAQMSTNAIAACAEVGVPLVAFTRPPWIAQASDRLRNRRRA